MVMLLVNDPRIEINTTYSVIGTPLDYALSMKDKVNVGIVWMLLSHTEINVNSRQGMFSPIRTALRLGNKEIVSLLLDKPELILDMENDNIFLRVDEAIETGDPEIVQMLLNHHQVRKRDVRKTLRATRTLGEYKDIDRDVLNVLRDYLRTR